MGGSGGAPPRGPQEPGPDGDKAHGPSGQGATTDERPSWSAWAASPGRAGLFTDFDGTLSAIVDDPATAVPLPGVHAVLERLASSLACVAVISGRPVAYLEHRLGRTGDLHLVGLYGMESSYRGRRQVSTEAAKWMPLVSEITTSAQRALRGGLEVEAKGLSVVLHARRAPEQMSRALEWADDVAKNTGLLAKRGRMSVELLPPVGTDKGSIVRELAQGLAAAAFLGDDRGDIPAFDALKDLANTGLTTRCIAVASPESPPELLEKADAVVDGPGGALELLEELVEALAGTKTGEAPGLQ